MNAWPKFLLLLLTFAGNALSQTASLRGLVSDALSTSPLGGVSVVVGVKTSGVSGPDGRYLVPGLKQGEQITLTYDKGGYGKYVVTVRLAGRQLVRDVALLKETVDAAYWSSWSQKRVAASSQNGKAIVASAWREVERGGLSAEAKSVAARSLLAIAPTQRDAPESMLAAAGSTKEQGVEEAQWEGPSPNSDIVKRIDASAKILTEIMATPDQAIPDKVITEAKCLVVVPSTARISFGLGGDHGSGIATCRTADGWSAPAPITITGGSWGLQLGGQAMDLVMVVMNDQGMQHLISSNFKLGADASAAAGPVGRYAAADTDWKMKAEVLTYSRARGVFAGIDLNGARITQDQDQTRTLYGKKISIERILGGGVRSPKETERFLGLVRKYSEKG